MARVLVPSLPGPAPAELMPEPANLQEQIRVLAAIPRQNQGSRLLRANDGRWWATLGNNGRLWVRDIETRESLLYDVYEIINGLWGFHIDPMPGEDATESMKKPGQLRLQHARKWLQTRSATYKSELRRKFLFNGVELPADAPEVVALHQAYDEMQLDLALQGIDFAMQAYGNVVARVHWDVDTSRPVLHRYPAYRVRAVENSANPRYPWALLLMGQRTERDNAMRANLVDVGEVWTASGMFAEIIGGRVGAYSPIETQRPPLAVFADSLQDNESGFFVDALGVPLARLNVVLNEDLWTPFGNTLLMQGFGQWIGYNLGKKTQFELGPNRMMAVDSNPENPARVENIQPNAPLSDIREAIDRIMREIRFVYDVPESEFEAVTEAASGKVIVEARMPTLERREERLKIFRQPENELMRATLDVLSTYAGLKLRGKLSAYSVSVMFERVEAGMSVTDRIAQEKHDLDLGLTSPAELLMKRQPDRFKTIEQAQAELDRRQAQHDARKAPAQEKQEILEADSSNENEDEGEDGEDENLDTSSQKG